MPISTLPVGTKIPLLVDGDCVYFVLDEQQPGLTVWLGCLTISSAKNSPHITTPVAIPFTINDHHRVGVVSAGNPLGMSGIAHAWLNDPANAVQTVAKFHLLETAYAKIERHINMDLHQKPLVDWPVGAPLMVQDDGPTVFSLTSNDANVANFVANKKIKGGALTVNARRWHADGISYVRASWKKEPRHNNAAKNLALLEQHETLLEADFNAALAALPKWHVAPAPRPAQTWAQGAVWI